jgi:hypothetical protein
MVRLSVSPAVANASTAFMKIVCFWVRDAMHQKPAVGTTDRLRQLRTFRTTLPRREATRGPALGLMR